MNPWNPEECAAKLREYTIIGSDYLVLDMMGDILGWPSELLKDKLIPML